VSDTRFDLVVIGGGPGGYVAAIRAAQLGLRVALAEREHLGGICLNWGCIPTKALLHAADVWRGLGHTAALGLDVAGASFDYARVVARSRAVAAQLNQGVRQLLKKHQVQVFAGRARLEAPTQVMVDDGQGRTQALQARHVIIATGARARELPGAAADGRRIWTYRHALAAGERPASLLVIGAGAIGLEMASLYAAFGTRVTVAEAAPRVLPAEDEELSAFVAQAYRAQGIELRTATAVAALQPGADGVQATLRDAEGSRTLTVERVLVAIGVVGNTEDLGLERCGVRVHQGHVVAGAGGATGVPGVYAIGDVAGPPCLAHKAMHEGIACAEHIAGGPPAPAIDPAAIPSCTYGHPQTASLGLSEAAARARGRPLRIGRFPFRGNGKAIALGEPAGFIKTLFDAETGELLGAHCVGPDVTELIHSIGIARGLEATEEDLMATIFPHPTLSEGLHESVLAAFDRALHA
jgi:dihydrolipoamide dehydrogenase